MKLKLLLVMTAFMLAACVGDAEPVVTAPPPPDKTVQAPAPVEVAPATPTPREVPDLMTLTAADVQYELGAPSLVRRDGPVQTMLYESGFCVLDVTLMEGSPDEYFRVQHIVARAASGSDVDFEACVANFLLDPYGTSDVR